MVKKKKVVHLSNAQQGISLFLMPQLKELIKLGYEVHAICPVNDDASDITNQSIKVHSVPVGRDISIFGDLILFLRLWFIMVSERYFIVHAHSAKMEFFGQLAARLALVPHVFYTNHGMIFRSEMPSSKTAILKQIAKFSGKLSSLIFSQSQEDIDYARQENIYQIDKLRFLGNGINITDFNRSKYSKADRLSVKKELGLNDDDIVIGMVARFVREKGYHELFYAAHELVKENRNLYFLCIGNEMPNERDPINNELPKELGVEDRFIILKSQKEMSKFYAIMDVAVLPSYREGYPRTLMEASSTSVPVVASDISGCRETVKSGYNGILVPARDHHALANALKRLILDKQLRSKMAANGRKMAVEIFDESRVVDRLIKGYNEVLK